ncbi:hypothetical protein TMEN_6299 [Trichophyton mentagrophytes]|nr:hypothetical protein TMEN_6299 [Trichophyton mentagrophytes]
MHTFSVSDFTIVRQCDTHQTSELTLQAINTTISAPGPVFLWKTVHSQQPDKKEKFHKSNYALILSFLLLLSTPSTMFRSKQPQRGAMRSSQPPKRPQPPKKPSYQVNQGGIHAPKSHWPVWKMRYRAEGVSKVLRIEWHHKPKSDASMNETLSVLHEYVSHPCDDIVSFHGRGFRDLKPEFCIVTGDSHPTTKSKTDREPDTDLHLSLHFSSASDRAQRRGHSVHIYVDPITRKHRRKLSAWTSPTPDDENMRAVYDGRTEWPPETNASDCRWAPGHEPRPPPSTEGLVDAPAPKTNPWAR